LYITDVLKVQLNYWELSTCCHVMVQLLCGLEQLTSLHRSVAIEFTSLHKDHYHVTTALLIHTGFIRLSLLYLWSLQEHHGWKIVAYVALQVW